MLTPNDFYRQRLEQIQDRLRGIRETDRKLSHARGAVFLVALVLFLSWATGFGTWLLVLAGLVFLGFIGVLARHEAVQRILHRESINQEIVELQMARMLRDWDALPQPLQDPSDVSLQMMDRNTIDVDDTTAADLALVGPGSLWSLVNQAATPWGQSTLHAWLRSPSSPEEIESRQAAVRWLQPQVDLWLPFYLQGRLLAHARGPATEFVDWAEGDDTARGPVWRTWLLYALAFAITVVLTGLAFGWLPPGFVFLALALVGANVVCNMLWIGAVHDTFNKISSGKYDLDYFIALFRTVDSLPTDVPRLNQLRVAMSAEDTTFEKVLGQLQRILRFANGRKSGLLGVLWLFAQILWFWDFHVLAWLRRWQLRFGDQVRPWFEAVGELEALCSLATLAHDHPNWVFPIVASEEPQFVAEAMAHPLLPPDHSVANPVQVGPAGNFLLVTGSNMSGKSTLLRAIGVNTVLALAGGPVCAESLRLAPLVVTSSMRISDSLQSGVSFFMAELQRVKAIVDHANERSESGNAQVLYLLDEILQGTNSAERHIAVVRILQHLLHTRAIGCVSTHDLELASAPDIQERSDLVHLRETIEKSSDGERMRFDYIVREGVTPTTNALRLLDVVGLQAFESDQ